MANQPRRQPPIAERRIKEKPNTSIVVRTNSQRSPQKYRGAQYQYSSSAVEIAPMYDERIKRSRKQQKLRRKLIISRKKPKFQMAESPERKVTANIVIFSTVVFACVFAYVLSFALVSVGNNNIAMLQRQLTNIQTSNNSLQASIAYSYNLNEIKSKAEALNMAKPLDSQIVYIQVPEETYFTQNTTSLNKPAIQVSNNLIDNFLAIFSGKSAKK